ncbi:MAG: SusC/RagA family TonB-linked outer membrane protein [Prevotellaceae bacterium]|jgi:TonB-linked SusC/RagA family outer membrane protein|nr:SusC/RagA family TonB-linked outer membrane protein [Prevotellaceae bacterium]
MSAGVFVYALVGAPVAYAQEGEQKQDFIAGKVVDAKNAPIAGVTVAVKGTSVGAITDAEGTFLLRAFLPPDAQLHLSLLGMEPLTLPAKNRPAKGIWTIVMREGEQNIDDIIVTGYQNIKKNELTGSIKQVKAIDVMQGGKLSIDQMLAGQIAGMQVITSSGEPSATAKIRIRGTSSIVSNKAPLWVLDGIILEDINPGAQIDYSNLDGDDAPYLIGNAIAGVNPQDIESINVLKDAAATALYGVQAANGVIVVTTKKGREGPPKVSYSGNASVNMRNYYTDLYLMNSAERVLLSKEIEALGLKLIRYPTDIGYEGLRYQLNNKGAFEGKTISSRKDFEAALITMAGRNTDWYALLFRNAVSHNHTVSLTGGNETTTYYASLGYNQTPGTAIGSESERYNAMLKLSSWLHKRLYVNFQLSGSIADNTGFFTTNPDSWARTTSRAIPVYNDDGSLFFFETEKDPAKINNMTALQLKISKNYLNELQETGQTGKTSNLTAKLDVRWEIWDRLRYELSGSAVSQNATVQSWATERSHHATEIRGYPYGAVAQGSEAEESSKLSYGGIFESSNREQQTYTIRNQLAYEKELTGEHVVSAQATSEIRSIPSNGFASTAYGWRRDRGQLISPVVNGSNYQQVANAVTKPTITDNIKNYVSWLGLASYAYKGKAMINGNIRMDGSNQFGDNPKYRFLPVWSVSGRYILTEEAFLQHSAFLSYLALRASYGVQGNVDKNTSPDLVAKIEPYNSYYHFDMSTIAMLPNPDLRWEKTVSYNAGADFSLWDKRIAGTVDVYKKMASDLVMSTQVSHVTGQTSVKINAGNMENTGLEFDLTGYPVRSKNWEFSVNLIYAYNKNVLTKANELIDNSDNQSVKSHKSNMVNGNALIVGEALGTLYSYRFAELNHNNGLPVFYDNGATTYVNANGEETPNYMVYVETADTVKSGLKTPPATGGVNLGLRYKNLRLRAGLVYSLGGVKRLPALYSSLSNLLDPSFNVTREYADRWREPGDEAFTNIPALYNSDTYSSGSAYYKPWVGSLYAAAGRAIYDKSDVRVASTDNIRMHNVTLSYLFDEALVKPLRLSSVMLSLQVTNLFLIAHKEWHGLDPEQSETANASLPRTFTVSLNINF